MCVCWILLSLHTLCLPPPVLFFPTFPLKITAILCTLFHLSSITCVLFVCIHVICPLSLLLDLCLPDFVAGLYFQLFLVCGFTAHRTAGFHWPDEPTICCKLLLVLQPIIRTSNTSFNCQSITFYNNQPHFFSLNSTITSLIMLSLSDTAFALRWESSPPHSSHLHRSAPSLLLYTFLPQQQCKQHPQ